MNDLTPEILRRDRPDLLRVHLASGETREIRPPARHRKWMTVQRTISQLDWQAVELVDDSGMVSRVVERPGAEPSAELVRDPHDDLSKDAKMILAAQELTLRHHTGAQAELIGALRDMLTSANERIASLETALSNAYALLDDTTQRAVDATLAAADATAEARSAAESGGMQDALSTFAAAYAAQGEQPNGDTTPKA